jgi:hypothetical protein
VFAASIPQPSIGIEEWSVPLSSTGSHFIDQPASSFRQFRSADYSASRTLRIGQVRPSTEDGCSHDLSPRANASLCRFAINISMSASSCAFRNSPFKERNAIPTAAVRDTLVPSTSMEIASRLTVSQSEYSVGSVLLAQGNYTSSSSIQAAPRATGAVKGRLDQKTFVVMFLDPG